MKLTKKNGTVFRRLLLFGLIAGSLFWELLERCLALSGLPIQLSVGPIGFDIKVLAIWMAVNPGTVLGLLMAFLLFRRL